MASAPTRDAALAAVYKSIPNVEDDLRPASKVARSPGRSTVVAPSPFNEIKLELGIALLLGLLLLLASDLVTREPLSQVLLLLGYGSLATAWLLLRTRRALRRCRAGADEQRGP
jgi:uncharacterized membrane protein